MASLDLRPTDRNTMIEPLDVGMVGLGAAAVVEVVKLFGVNSHRWLRLTSVCSAVVLMVVVTLATGVEVPENASVWGAYTLAVFGAGIAGITSGLAASKLYDTFKEGLDHRAVDGHQPVITITDVSGGS